MTVKPWGWAGTVAEFLATDEHTWVHSLVTHHESRLAELALDRKQLAAWRETFALCRQTLSQAVSIDSQIDQCLLVAEYELPGEAGRRPDLLLIIPAGHVLVLEFKSKSTASLADFDQVIGYARDLKGYHSATHELDVTPILVVTKSGSPPTVPASHSDVLVAIPRDAVLVDVNRELLSAMHRIVTPIDPALWLDGDYLPLPGLVQAASQAFRNNELPAIKSVKHLNSLLDWLANLTQQCEAQQRHALVLVTGAPGSGKTLLGLQTVADQTYIGRNALYLSGNGPLVGVLQDCIDRLHIERAAKAMIRGMIEFKRGATGSMRYAPGNVYVFDEGQRAWTTVRDFEGSEIQLLLTVAQRRPWSVVLGLIGEGQEIYTNEDGDLRKWISDFNATPLQDTWTVYAPTMSVPPTKGELVVVPGLHLDSSVRAKQLLSIHEWVNALLSSQSAGKVQQRAGRLHASGFPVYCTRERTIAENYVHEAYSDMPSRRFGWVASSANKARRTTPDRLPQVRTGRFYSEYRTKYGPWYNDPTDSPAASNALREAVSEFGCQGLELDFVLVEWGEDLVWRDNDWVIGPGVRAKGGKPREHTLNAYRVLLTRAREGMVIHCADEQTYQRLTASGVQPL